MYEISNIAPSRLWPSQPNVELSIHILFLFDRGNRLKKDELIFFNIALFSCPFDWNKMKM